MLGVIGEDGFGSELERKLVGPRNFAGAGGASAAVPTFTYTKLINARQRR